MYKMPWQYAFNIAYNEETKDVITYKPPNKRQPPNNGLRRHQLVRYSKVPLYHMFISQVT